MRTQITRPLTLLFVALALAALAGCAPASYGGVPVQVIAAENQATAVILTVQADGTRAAYAAATQVVATHTDTSLGYETLLM